MKKIPPIRPLARAESAPAWGAVALGAVPHPAKTVTSKIANPRRFIDTSSRLTPITFINEAIGGVRRKCLMT
ncbi:hypothetical protein D3C87_1657750 [compost metagenome]